MRRGERDFSSRANPLRARIVPVVRFAGLMLVCVVSAQAQEAPRHGGPSFIRVHGQATITVQPDEAEFDIGVVTQVKTAKAATDQNAGQPQALIHQLHSAFPSANIKSINFSVNPIYRYPQGGAPVTAAYTANNTVHLSLNSVSGLQNVIEIAIESGAKSINRLNFTLHNEDQARDRVLAEAAGQAQAEAEALAASLKLNLGRLLSVEESQPVIVSPPRVLSFERLQSANLEPISPGMIDVHADVDLTYEIERVPPAH